MVHVWSCAIVKSQKLHTECLNQKIQSEKSLWVGEWEIRDTGAKGFVSESTIVFVKLLSQVIDVKCPYERENESRVCICLFSTVVAFPSISFFFISFFNLFYSVTTWNNFESLQFLMRRRNSFCSKYCLYCIHSHHKVRVLLDSLWSLDLLIVW